MSQTSSKHMGEGKSPNAVGGSLGKKSIQVKWNWLFESALGSVFP